MKILIAEDDYDLRTIVSDLLEARGFQTALAADGEEALERALGEGPQLIILDLSMPKIDGFTVLRRLREMPQTLKTPVIAFTAHALKGDAQKSLDAGFDAYVAKPFRPEDLLAEIQRLLK